MSIRYHAGLIGIAENQVKNFIVFMAVVVLAACSKSADPGSRNTAPADTIALVNGDFEQAATDEGIPGWMSQQHAGPPSYEMVIDAQGAYAGHGSFRMTRKLDQVYGMLWQGVAVAGFAGRTVELSAMMKTSDVGEQGWVLIISTPELNVRELSPKLTGTTDWQRVSVRAQLPPGTSTIKVGAVLLDGGSGWMDDVQLRTIAR
jgi:hypothetical protein